MQIIIENNGISYEDYISKGGRTRDLEWDLDKCHVSPSETRWEKFIKSRKG